MIGDVEFDDDLFEEEEILSDRPGEFCRKQCPKCLRPVSVCLCAHILSPKHPNEIKRPLRTMPLLEAALDDCHIIRCRRVYSLERPDLKSLLKDKQPFLLFPSDDALTCENLPDNAALIAIDGTWRQARNILFTSTGLSQLPKCRIDVSKNQFKNQYIIRTQPEEGFVSTLEAISAALAESEGDNTLYEKLTAPLRALCAIQLEHGAQQHHSKQELLAKGIWDGDRPSKNRNKLNRERLLIERYHKLQLDKTQENEANQEELKNKLF